MKTLLAIVLVLSAADIAFAQKPATVKAECRKVLEENFEACNEKDLKGLIATCSRYTGTRAQGLEFMREAQKMFDETSVIMRVEKMELLSFDPPEAVFLVRQSTLPNNESDHKPKGPGLNYRHHSALLPEWQEVEYQQKFWYEGGKWKVHLILTPPVPVEGTKPLLAEQGPGDGGFIGEAIQK